MAAPVKAARDPLEYRHVALPNGLRALLVCDADADIAAAAVDVRVGHFADPPQRPGLAHLLEHMLFYASERFPEEEAYREFVTSHGGSCNAYTACEDTNYHFGVHHASLAGALDRFSAFFTCPLVSEEGLSREVKAVNNENEKNIPSEPWRQLQLWRHGSDPDHAYHKYNTGNSSTLQPEGGGSEVHAELLGLYREQYSANRMALAVVGRETLDDLEEMVRRHFADVVNRDLPPLAYPGSPLRPQDLGTLTRVVPVTDVRSVELKWLVPPNQSPAHYRSLPANYISHLVGHEGEGSILAELKTRGWASGLSAGESADSYSEHSFFTVKVDLTEDGEANVATVVGLILQYIDIVRGEGGVARWIHDECALVSRTRFDFRDKMDSCALARSLSASMHLYAVEDLLLAMCGVQLEFDEDAVRATLACMTVENLRIMQVSRAFADVADSAEPWYGTKYASGPIPAEWREAWAETEREPALHLPAPNDFLPSDFEVPPAPAGCDVPAICRTSPLSTLWWKPDTLFASPKGCAYLNLMLPDAYAYPEACVLTRLFTKMLTDDLNKFVYQAEIAGLSYAVEPTNQGISLRVQGFSHRLLRLVRAILDRFVDFVPSAERFGPVRAKVSQDYRNIRYGKPLSHAMYCASCLLESSRFHYESYIACVDSLTLEQLHAHVARLFSRLWIEAYVGGNVAREDAEALIAGVEERLVEAKGSRPLGAAEIVVHRTVRLPADRSMLLVEASPNDADSNSASHVVFQIGPDDLRTNTLAELVVQALKRDAFSTLRTKQQLGYMVFLLTRLDYTVHGIQFVLQSAEYHAAYLEERVDDYVERASGVLDGLSETEFAEHVDALLATKTEKLKSIYQESRRHWREIVVGTRVFDRVDREAEVLRSLTKAELVAFFRERVAAGGAGRRRLAVRVRSAAHAAAAEAAGGEPAAGGPGTEVVGDIWAVKRTLELYAAAR